MREVNSSFLNFQRSHMTRYWWLTPIILATCEAKVRNITAGDNLGKKFARPHLNRKSYEGGVEGRGGGMGKGRVMTQSLYAHMSKGNLKKRKRKS
jgi:hypothetical protein